MSITKDDKTDEQIIRVENLDVDELSVTKVKEFIPCRIFMNHVDSFNAKHIASYITNQIYGVSKIPNADIAPEELEEVPEDAIQHAVEQAPQFPYEIIGTLKEPYHHKPEDVLAIINESVENHLDEILKCGIIIFDITQDAEEIRKVSVVLKAIENHLSQFEELGRKTMDNLQEERVFILLSTVMTWGRTKPLNPHDPTIAFSEIDYKKRRPHPNFKQLLDCEREVIMKGRKFPDKFKTYVVGCGIIYGFEEEDFASLFRMAWNNEKYLPIFTPGTNYIPVIHIVDVANVLHKLLENPPVKPQFILAVEQTPVYLRSIIKAISKELGTGMVKEVPPAEAFLYHDIKQRDFDILTINLKMEPVFITETLQISWRNNLSFSNNMKNIVEEFKTARKLGPLKIVILGPPASGKTMLAKKICEKYNTKYVSVQTMIEDTMEDLRQKVANEREFIKSKEKKKQKSGFEEEDDTEEIDEEEEELDFNVEDLEEQLNEIVASMSSGRIPDQTVVRMMRQFLSKNYCQNRGYVLDNFPKTSEQAKELFGLALESGDQVADEETENEEPANVDQYVDDKIVPEFVISLDAPDDFLCNRLMKLPERDVHNTRYTEENMIKRLGKFREMNTEDETVLNFFDDVEIHPILLDITVDNCVDMECIFMYVCDLLGRPVEFGLSSEEEHELALLEKQRLDINQQENQLQQKILEEKAKKEYHNKMELWTEMLEKLQMEEEKLLVARSEPLRHYLMKFVFPVLTKGLLEVVKIKPEDPVDFLAEYLFRENPEGRMFDPSYTKQGEELLNNYKKDVEQVLENFCTQKKM